MNDELYMHEAIDEALQGIRSGDGGPFGCVIVKDGRVIARGHNRVLSSNDPTAHGEITAIRAAGQTLGTYDLTGCELYTSAEPCPMCAAAIAWANIKRVVYACTALETFEHLGFRDDELYEKLQAGEDLTPSEKLQVEGYLQPFEEYAQMEGTVY